MKIFSENFYKTLSLEEFLDMRKVFVWKPTQLRSGGWMWLRFVYYQHGDFQDIGLLGILVSEGEYYTREEATMKKLAGG